MEEKLSDLSKAIGQEGDAAKIAPRAGSKAYILCSAFHSLKHSYQEKRQD